MVHDDAAVVRSWFGAASKYTGGSTRIRNLAGKGRSRPRTGPNTNWFAVTGKYGNVQELRQATLLNTIGIASSFPTIANGTIGTPARMRDLHEAAPPETTQL